MADDLRKRGISISSAGVRCVWQRHEYQLYLALNDIEHTFGS